VIRAGYAVPDVVLGRAAQLRASLSAGGYAVVDGEGGAASGLMLAQYNELFALPWKRDNEVWLRVEPLWVWKDPPKRLQSELRSSRMLAEEEEEETEQEMIEEETAMHFVFLFNFWPNSFLIEETAKNSLACLEAAPACAVQRAAQLHGGATEVGLTRARQALLRTPPFPRLASFLFSLPSLASERAPTAARAELVPSF